jgi:RNA polymerase sigma factor (sigma-70 family)
VLYDAHVDRVFRLAYRLTGDDDHARELTQDTFIRAFNQLGRFRGDSALATWLYRITITVASNIRRRQRRRDREIDLSVARELAADGPPAADPDLSNDFRDARCRRVHTPGDRRRTRRRRRNVQEPVVHRARDAPQSTRAIREGVAHAGR